MNALLPGAMKSVRRPGEQPTAALPEGQARALPSHDSRWIAFAHRKQAE